MTTHTTPARKAEQLWWLDQAPPKDAATHASGILGLNKTERLYQLALLVPVVDRPELNS